MEPTELTPEQVAANKARAKAEAAEKKAAAKKAEADAKLEAKEKDRIEKARLKDEAKAQAKAEREAKAQAKADAAAEKKALKEANRMPEQNGVRRPKPDGLCGRAWALADKLSAELGQPTPIANLLEAARAEGLSEGNVKTEYARWRKFNGVTGRVSLPVEPVETPAATTGDE